MAKKRFYAIKNGRVPGIYTTWDEAKAQVDGFPGAVRKGFATEAEDKVLGIHPYWDPEVMKSKFDSANDPDSLHDAITYRAAEPELMRTYEANKDRVTALMAELLPNLDLAGQWSIDIMQDGDDLWLIDMALAENSAFYRETVPAGPMRPSEEHWMPELPATED